MRRGNLFDYMQSQNMRCIFIDFLQIQSRKNFRGIAFAVVGYCQAQKIFSYFSFDTDFDRFRIMPHAVAQQIFEKAQEMISAIMKLKPQTLKGTYMKGASICTTMSPGIKLDIKSFSSAE